MTSCWTKTSNPGSSKLTSPQGWQKPRKTVRVTSASTIFLLLFFSLHSNSQLDVNIKGGMIKDLLNLAGYMIPDKHDVKDMIGHEPSYVIIAHIPFQFARLTCDVMVLDPSSESRVISVWRRGCGRRRHHQTNASSMRSTHSVTKTKFVIKTFFTHFV